MEPITFPAAVAIMKLGKHGYKEGVYCPGGRGSAKMVAAAAKSPAFDDDRSNTWEAKHYHPGSYNFRYDTHAWYTKR